MKIIIVTGGSGFIGRHCLEELVNKNYEVHVLGRSSIASITRVNWHSVDLFDLSKVSDLMGLIKPNYLMHLAWEVEPGLNLNSDNNEKWYNLSKEIIKIFYQNQGERVLVSGSGFEYDLYQKRLNENDTPLIPNNEYGKNKKKLFSFIQNYANEHNSSYVWARIFFAYGPGQKSQSLLPYVISRIIENNKVETTDGNQQYDYIYIKDVATALVLLLECNYNGAVNVSTGNVIKLKDMVLRIAKYFNKENLLLFGAINRPVGTPDYILGENNLLKKLTCWEQKYDADKGIMELINYFKSNHESL